MKTLFDAERMTIDDALQMTIASLGAYANRKHWCIAYSGGKDSSATLTACLYLVEAGLVPQPESITVLYADTRLELPNLQAAAMNLLQAVHRRAKGWKTQVVYPRLDKRFYVMVLGRGIPPSHSGFRWCTGALKVEPMEMAMKQIRQRVGEKLLMITGMRVGESANRDKRIALSCGKNGGECGQGWYEETTPAEVADVLSPLLHWRTCHVWDWLMLHRNRHRFDCRQVAEVYDQDAEGSAQEVLARTGCLVCPVAARDFALERTIGKPEWSYLAPLLQLRQLYDELSQPHNRLRKSGERKADGTLSSHPMRLGPLLIDVRIKALDRVCAIEAQINGVAGRRPHVSLINSEELARIQELILAKTWPDGWTGEESTGAEDLPEIHRDGMCQGILFPKEQKGPYQ